MWCSEQSVGEDVVPLLLRAGIEWTIGDQTVLSRSIAGTAPAIGADPTGPSPYIPYLLQREAGQVAIFFRDHTLSDLIGFGYQSWDSRDAANDLLNRIRAIGTSLSTQWSTDGGGAGDGGAAGTATPGRRPASNRPPLVTIALDGENAW